MPGPVFEYKIRVQFPKSYGYALARLSARENKSVTALIREFTGAGLLASGIDMSTDPIKGQIELPEGDA